MLECYCRTDIWRMCRRQTGEPPQPVLVQLKGKPEKAVRAWEYEGFWTGGMSEYGFIWMPEFEKKRARNDIFRHAAGMFSRKGELLFAAFVKERFGGDLKAAILKARNFDTLFEQFTEWFEERKQKFMDKTAELIRQIRPDLKNITKISTHSHGGVANLLKVLTKTMHEQGSTIRTIAKVQYAVCTQAGIYVPEEFMTDVLTAADIDPEVLDGE